ncbi:hypothetical protein NMY22_g811 [Coprinellus aureogranulatus]|nr:hypothetical protein NMY22_g811 [Coprinellus aureogranulatus]
MHANSSFFSLIAVYGDENSERIGAGVARQHDPALSMHPKGRCRSERPFAAMGLALMYGRGNRDDGITPGPSIAADIPCSRPYPPQCLNQSLRKVRLTAAAPNLSIRNRLTALKKDRGEFIKAQDVNSLYKDVVKQVQKLNAVRDDNKTYNNRLDTTLADVFALLSLFFLTIGKTKDTPAAYSQIASMRQILDHMNESNVYNESDLKPFQKRLAELRDIVSRDAEAGKHPKALTKLLERQLNECDMIVKQLLDSLSVLSPELVPVHQKLISIRRQLVALAAKEGSHKAELKPLQEELRKIDSLSTSPV